MARTYGNWNIIKSLSEGGQAHTFIVKREQDELLYVLKRLKNINRIDRFEKEIEAVKKLDHSNVLKLIDSDIDSDSPYMVTKYCSGGALSDKDFYKWTSLEKLELFHAICLGVAHAHSRNVVHRDIKPENIFLLEDGATPVVGDFGICFITDLGERFTLTDEAVGAKYYMAPEMEDGREELIGKTSDVYSLGKLLYWIFEGKIFSREKHREYDWDLANNQTHDLPDFIIVERAFVNELLDWSIHEDVNHRFSNADHFRRHVEITIRRIMNNAHPIGKDVFQICNYCGKGHYKIIDDSNMSHDNKFERFGISVIDSAEWVVLHCSYCGHLESFRVDILPKNPWKERIRPW